MVIGRCYLDGFWRFNLVPINIRNAAKMELNNVSARITFHSQREANLDSYMADLHLSSAYQEALRAGFIPAYIIETPQTEGNL